MGQRVIRVGIIGAGFVGSALVELLSDPSRHLALVDAATAPIEVVGVCVRDATKPHPAVASGLITTDAEGLIDTEGLDILVEVAGGLEPARSYIERALDRGVSVVSANKALMAEAGTELAQRAHEHGADLFYEAAVGGGIPILRALRTSLAGERIERVMGIVNGTTNFILSKMTSEGRDYAEAPREAPAPRLRGGRPHRRRRGLRRGGQGADPRLAGLRHGARGRGDLARGHRRGARGGRRVRPARRLRDQAAGRGRAGRRARRLAPRPPGDGAPRPPPRGGQRRHERRLRRGDRGGPADVAGPGRGRAAHGHRGPRRRARRRAQPRERAPRRALQRRHDPHGGRGRGDLERLLPQPRRARRARRALERGRGPRSSPRLPHPRRAHQRRARDPRRAREAGGRRLDRRVPAGHRWGRVVTGWRGLLVEYAGWLDLDGVDDVVTLQEGNTPLIRADRLSERLEADVWLKFEGLNPSGSFKDRGMTMAITKAKAANVRTVICGSTGNTSAAAAAYAAKAGMDCVVLVPEGKISLGKLAQAIVYGAQVIQIRGNFDQALNLARELTQHLPITIVNSINPDRIEGQKTGAFEIVDVLGRAPDVLSIPVGNAGNITAYWRGFTQYHFAERCKELPKMWGFQAAGAAPIVLGHPVTNPETIATAIRIGNPASWVPALEVIHESLGDIRAVTDDEILDASRFLARYESIFCEPASAASVAGVLKYGVPEGSTVVCVLTGNGLKDPDTAVSTSASPPVVDATIKALLHELE